MRKVFKLCETLKETDLKHKEAFRLTTNLRYTLLKATVLTGGHLGESVSVWLGSKVCFM